MIAVVIQHWILLCSVGNNLRRSFHKAAEYLREWVFLLTKVLSDGRRPCQTLCDLTATIGTLCCNNLRCKHPGNIQLLLNPELLEYAA